MTCTLSSQWRPGKYSSIFAPEKASTHPVLELATDILMHLAHDEACRARMHELGLEPVLERLLYHEEGTVRQHVLKVSVAWRISLYTYEWVRSNKQKAQMTVRRLPMLYCAMQVLFAIRDQDKLKACTQDIVAGIQNLKLLAALYGGAPPSGEDSSTNMHKRTAGWIISKMRGLQQEDDLRVGPSSPHAPCSGFNQNARLWGVSGAHTQYVGSVSPSLPPLAPLHGR